jgi:hypothetical protein
MILLFLARLVINEVFPWVCRTEREVLDKTWKYILNCASLIFASVELRFILAAYILLAKLLRIMIYKYMYPSYCYFDLHVNLKGKVHSQSSAEQNNMCNYLSSERMNLRMLHKTCLYATKHALKWGGGSVLAAVVKYGKSLSPICGGQQRISA